MMTSIRPGAAQETEDLFAMAGDDVRIHKGRSVVTLSLNGKTHFLKRFWFVPSQAFKRYVARGFHELRMIDWLGANGFAGPNVVRRGHRGIGPFRTHVYFLMEEVPDELPLERAWHGCPDARDELLKQLAAFAARLHDAGFVHTDFSERHILTHRDTDAWRFRLIDVERARVLPSCDKRAACDLATLAASVMSDQLRTTLNGGFLDEYISQRQRLTPGLDFRALVARSKSAGSFS